MICSFDTVTVSAAALNVRVNLECLGFYWSHCF